MALLIAGIAIGFGQATGKSVDEVLFSGQDQLPGLVASAGGYSLGALALLLVGKGVALRVLAGELPRGTDLPGDLSRGGRGDHDVAPAGIPDHRRRGRRNGGGRRRRSCGCR